MALRAPSLPTINVMLRDVIEDDLPFFFEHQRDPDATQMAAFPTREREPFDAHWTRILAHPAIIKKTILFEEQIAGNLVSFEQDGKVLVGYWLSKRYWGLELAPRAL